jgi:hypothetical protein
MDAKITANTWSETPAKSACMQCTRNLTS